jgi:cytochrome c-type biogenesis protein CcmH
MLGRTMMARQQYNEAVTAFQRSHDLLADEPGIMFALADALAMQNNGNLLGEPEELVQRGLKLAPRFPNGLWLAGMAAEQRQDYKAAHRYWSLLLPLIADNQASSREVQDLIAILEERDPELAKTVASNSDAVGIKLVVDISAELKARASPDMAVFIYARAMQGPPMPLAVRKLQLGDLPLSLTLSDDDAMMPTMKLSSFDQVIVGARVSRSGNPVAQDGDFYTEREAVDSNNPPAQIDLVIDQIK